MIKKELVVSNGGYTTKDGQEKTRWVKIGAVHEYEGKQYITLDGHIALPALIKDGDTRVFVNLFDPKSRDGGAPKKDFDDDMPF